MVLYLNEENIQEILFMESAIEVIEELFMEQAKRPDILNHPRGRLKNKKTMFHYMYASFPNLGFMGYKAYVSSKKGFTFRVFLHDIATGELLSIMDANHMGMIRTGAVTGVAAKYMSKQKSKTVAIFGTGFQAEGQLLALQSVRDINRINVFSRKKENRKAFSNKISELIDCEVVSHDSPKSTLKDADIVVTSTTSKEPVFDGKFVEKGMHITAIGNNFLFKREIDEKTIQNSSIVVVEDIEQTKLEAGEFLTLIDKGKMYWDQFVELKNVVSGKVDSRNSDSDITLFKSVGIAIEDIAIASHIYKIAKENKIGKNIDIYS